MSATALDKSTARNRLPVRNPRGGEIDMYITPPSPQEIAATCARLRKSQPAWGAAPLEYRISVMKKWAGCLQAHRARLIEADSIDTGYGQIPRVAPDMVIGSVLCMCAIAPLIFERSRRGRICYRPQDEIC